MLCILCVVHSLNAHKTNRRIQTNRRDAERQHQSKSLQLPIVDIPFASQNIVADLRRLRLQ
jgi:hypothetical protein